MDFIINTIIVINLLFLSAICLETLIYYNDNYYTIKIYNNQISFEHLFFQKLGVSTVLFTISSHAHLFFDHSGALSSLSLFFQLFSLLLTFSFLMLFRQTTKDNIEAIEKLDKITQYKKLNLEQMKHLAWALAQCENGRKMLNNDKDIIIQLHPNLKNDILFRGNPENIKVIGDY